MKKLFTVLIILLLLFTEASVFASAPQGATLSIIYTHDVHSYVEPHAVLIDGVVREAGGFARRKTLIDEAVRDNSATFVLDAGDFSMGTLIQTVYRERAAELVLMGELGYDAVTIGNHELDYRDNGFAQMLNTASASGSPLPELVISNLTAPDSNVQAALDAYGAKPYAIIERGGVRMAVFGLMGVDSLETAPMTKMGWEAIADAAKRIVKQIEDNESVDIIVALSHSGTASKSSKSEDERLAKAVPGIDVIISGHTHTFLADPITVGSTHIVSQGENGDYFSTLTLSKRSDGRWDVADSNHRLIDDRVAGDARISAMIDGYIRDASTLYLSAFGYSLGQVLAENMQAFTPLADFGVELCEDPLGNLISDSFRHAVQQAEGDSYEDIAMAMTAKGLVRGSLVSGDVTVLDAYNISSLGFGADGTPGYPLISIYITGKELKVAAEVDVSVSKLMSSAQLYSSGLCWDYNPKRLILNRVTDVWIEKSDGGREVIEDGKLYRVVTGLYCAQMLSAVESKSFGLLAITPKDKDGNEITDFEAHIIHDAQGREVKEWTAIAGYIASLGVIGDYYGATHGRKNSIPDGSIGAFLSKPNKVGKIAFAAAAVILLLIAFIIYRIVTRKKRKARKQEKRALKEAAAEL